MANQWHFKFLGDGIDSIEDTEAIAGAFALLSRALDQPLAMAVFTRFDSAAQTVTVFFTPEATPLAKVFGAHPCPKPLGGELGVLAGGRLAIVRHFPEGIGQDLYARA